jgi:tetratricopeptide (TPR) repeat protein
VAVDAASPNAPESAAWVNTRLALLEFQRGRTDEARQRIDAALGFQQDYAPALLLCGRLLLAEGNAAQAIDALQRAAPEARAIMLNGQAVTSTRRNLHGFEFDAVTLDLAGPTRLRVGLAKVKAG